MVHKKQKILTPHLSRSRSTPLTLELVWSYQARVLMTVLAETTRSKGRCWSSSISWMASTPEATSKFWWPPTDRIPWTRRWWDPGVWTGRSSSACRTWRWAQCSQYTHIYYHESCIKNGFCLLTFTLCSISSSSINPEPHCSLCYVSGSHTHLQDPRTLNECGKGHPLWAAGSPLSQQHR